MDSVSKARARLRQIPRLLAECSAESGTYARCVMERKDNLQKGDCAKEFQQLAACLRSAGKKHGGI
jgi:hypothetical protein